MDDKSVVGMGEIPGFHHVVLNIADKSVLGTKEFLEPGPKKFFKDRVGRNQFFCDGCTVA